GVGESRALGRGSGSASTAGRVAALASAQSGDTQRARRSEPERAGVAGLAPHGPALVSDDGVRRGAGAGGRARGVGDVHPPVGRAMAGAARAALVGAAALRDGALVAMAGGDAVRRGPGLAPRVSAFATAVLVRRFHRRSALLRSALPSTRRHSADL